MVMPQVPHRWHTGQVRALDDFQLLLFIVFSFSLDNINIS